MKLFITHNPESKDKVLISKVPGFKGICKPTWLNNSELDSRLDQGNTGFFKLVKKHWLWGYKKYGKEFHGIIKRDGFIYTTKT